MMEPACSRDIPLFFFTWSIIEVLLTMQIRVPADLTCTVPAVPVYPPRQPSAIWMQTVACDGSGQSICLGWIVSHQVTVAISTYLLIDENNVSASLSGFPLSTAASRLRLVAYPNPGQRIVATSFQDTTPGYHVYMKLVPCTSDPHWIEQGQVCLAAACTIEQWREYAMLVSNMVESRGLEAAGASAPLQQTPDLISRHWRDLALFFLSS